jgi:hypothetical protein
MSQTRRVPGAGSEGLRLGASAPWTFGQNVLPMAEILDRSLGLGLNVVELHSVAVEAFLGAPRPTVPLEPPPVDGIELGLLELELEVLQDSYDLARETFERQLRQWRASVPLAPLTELRRAFDDAGVRIEMMAWDHLTLLSDDELDYVFRAARMIGARAVTTGWPTGGLRRLASAADRHQVWLGIDAPSWSGPPSLDELFAYGRFIGITPDLAQWSADNRDKPLGLLTTHAARVIGVYLQDRLSADGGNVPFGEGWTPIREVLQAIRDHQWDVPAIVRLESWMPDGVDRHRALEQAVRYCRSSVE